MADRRTHPGTTPKEARGPRCIDGVVIGIDLDPFFSMKALADYSGLSIRKLRGHLTDPMHPLPHYRVGGKLLVRRSGFDAWIEHYRANEAQELDDIVAEVLEGVR
jgi:hypothetical protein